MTAQACQLPLFVVPVPTYTRRDLVLPEPPLIVILPQRHIAPVVIDYTEGDKRRLVRAIERLQAGDALYSKPYRLERIGADITEKGKTRLGMYVFTRNGWPLWKVSIPQTRYNSYGEIKEGDLFADRVPVGAFSEMARDILEWGVTDWFTLRCGAVYCGGGTKVKELWWVEEEYNGKQVVRSLSSVSSLQGMVAS